jgi:hypothetical protein
MNPLNQNVDKLRKNSYRKITEISASLAPCQWSNDDFLKISLNNGCITAKFECL